jgi:hypothetical protein
MWITNRFYRMLFKINFDIDLHGQYESPPKKRLTIP